MRHRLKGYCSVSASIIIAGLLATGPALGEEWHKAARYHCEDPLLLRAAAFVPQWLRKSPPFVVKLTGGDLQYAEISQALLNKGEISIGKVTVFDRRELTDSDALLLRGHLRKHSSSLEVLSYFSTIYTALLGYAGGVFAAAADKAIPSLFSFLSGRIEARKTNIDTLEFIVARGGFFTRSLLLEVKDEKALAIEVVEYHVPVGAEFRYTILFSCIYPARIALSGVRTVEGPNPKIFRERAEGIWVRVNAENNKIEREYKISSVDSNHLYMSEAGSVPEELRQHIRISRHNGPIEQRQPDGTWRPLYRRTEAF